MYIYNKTQSKCSNAQNVGNSSSHHKDVQWLHGRWHMGEHKSVKCHLRTISGQQTRFIRRVSSALLNI